eukprot:TRINITY_DN122576_c0_g1_i1.p1 TRINITY_DN122576_c0_g1~~TRINITY_DN122576_c0_g1_i1.p1  ORF type:complete len:303 (+),score=42.96 TRINITY_DN122576_c0_g1_i1:69-977(+)
MRCYGLGASRQRPMLSSLAKVILATVLVLGLACTQEAFVSSFKAAAAVTKAPASVRPAASRDARAEYFDGSAAGASAAVKCFGCAIALLALGTLQASTATPSSRKNGFRVTCVKPLSALPTPALSTLPVLPAPAAVAVALATPTTDLLSLAAPAPVATYEIHSLSFSAAEDSEPAFEFCGSSASTASSTPNAARRVGGARQRCRKSSRSASSSSERSSRRHVGATLLKASIQPVHVLVFDPSTLRTPIQMGLRVTASHRAESMRESRQPAVSKGMCLSRSVCILGNGESEQLLRDKEYSHAS